jgi:hypothetical protein
MNYNDLLWKCQGILNPTDYMRLAGLVVAEKELRHSKKMLEEELLIQRQGVIRACAEFARQHNLKLAQRSYMIHKNMKEHFGLK